MKEQSSVPPVLEDLPAEKAQRRLRALGRLQIAIALLGAEPASLTEIDNAFEKVIIDRCSPQEFSRLPQWAQAGLHLAKSMSEGELLASIDSDEKHKILSRTKDKVRDKRLVRAFMDKKCQEQVSLLTETDIQTFCLQGWQELVTPELGTLDAKLHQEGKRVFSSLKKLNIAFGGQESRGFGMQTSPEPFSITPAAWERTAEVGKTVLSVLQTANELYREAIAHPSKSTNQWFLNLLEGEAPDNVIKLQRNIFRSKNLTELTPFFIRLDQVDPGGGPAELESWGSGLGFQHAVQAVMTPDRHPTLAEAVTKRFQDKTGIQDPTVVFIQHNPKQVNESNFFTQECSKLGVNMIPIDFAGLDAVNLRQVHAVKKPRLRALLDHPRGLEIVRAWQNGKLVLEPPPNLLTDEKITLSLPFLEQTRDCFSEDVRERLLTTWLLADETEGVIRRTIKTQDLILKYAGNNPKPRGTILGVYKLSADNKSQSDKSLSMALELSRRQKDQFPWIVQPRVETKFPVKIWNAKKHEVERENRFARFNPVFIVDDTNTPELVSFTANFSQDWRVGGGKRTVTTAITRKEGKLLDQDEQM